YGGYHAQRCSAAIPAVGQAKSNWDVFCLLARGMGWNEPFFFQSADDLIEQLISFDTPWRSPATIERLRQGEPVVLDIPGNPRGDWKTLSGLIEILNSKESEQLPCLLPTHAEHDGFPLKLQPAVTPFALNSSFYEQEELRTSQKNMILLINPQDAQARKLTDGEHAVVYNKLGEVQFTLEITNRVPPGTVVTEGIWWQEFIPGMRGVNALTSQRLTDGGRGSTLYDVTVEVRKISVEDMKSRLEVLVE
ncbi:MAG: molybdopterin dinucleotide binding domain-containing protein, partial [Deltaproteobacteria bacterium]